MYETYPTYPMRRTLKLTTQHMAGGDVYALQTALVAAGFPLPQYGTDGDYGRETHSAVVDAQTALGLVVDGLAGGATQKALALRDAAAAQARYGLPQGALNGQLETESGFWLGICSPQRPDGSFDVGVAQRNSALTPPVEGFNVPKSIDALGQRVHDYYRKFDGIADKRRRWSLAQGAWNAPAFACYLARQAGASVPISETRKPTTEQRATFENYVANVSRYLQL